MIFLEATWAEVLGNKLFMSKISGIVIAKNEEVDLPDCLESLVWVDELVVVDNDSIDETAKIAKKYKAKIFSYKKEASTGKFSAIRNYAALKSSGDWLLYIDADERVGRKLKEEIQKTIKERHDNNAYAIPRKNILLGKEMKYGGWSPDYVLRLIKKSSLDGWEGELHEQPKITGSVGKLTERFTHITHTNLHEMLEKTNKWSEIEARLLYDSKHPRMNIFRFATAGLREFWYRGVRKMGFLDGSVGIIEIIYQTYSRLITYSKLWEMQIKKNQQ